MKVYRALGQQPDVRKSAVLQVIDRLFNGSPDSLLAHLVLDGEIDLEKVMKELGEREQPD